MIYDDILLIIRKSNVTYLITAVYGDFERRSKTNAEMPWFSILKNNWEMSDINRA